MYLHQFFVKGLGHASYLVGDADAGVAAAVDPRRDVGSYLELARDEGLRIVEILETHVHNDYVSGAEELRRRTGATVRVSADGGFTRPHAALHDGDELLVGRLRFRAIATPGHTPDHISFVVADLSRSSDDWVLFAGGALLVGTAARPDLLGGPEDARRNAALEFATLRDRIAALPDWLEVYPTHGAGSLCGTGIGGKRWSTIGYERRNNPALRQPDADAFTRYILRDQPTIPAYWRRMRAVNQAGAPMLETVPEPRPIDADALHHSMGHDSVVVDARDPDAFAEEHIPGSLGIGLGQTFGTWVGSFVPADRDIVLVLERPADLDEALAQLHRAGYDRISGYLFGGFEAWRSRGLPVESLPLLTPEELARQMDEGAIRVVDVREASEFREGHIPGAVHIPAGQLPNRLAELPSGPLAIACGGGYRSTVAASVLAREGFEDVANVAGGTSAYQAAGHPLEIPLEGRRPAGARA